MTLKVMAAAAAIASLLPGAAMAAEGIGVGSAQCSRVVYDYQANNTVAVAEYVRWAEGYVSGLNEYLQATTGRQADLTPNGMNGTEAMFNFVYNYCGANPNHVLEQAALAYFEVTAQMSGV